MKTILITLFIVVYGGIMSSFGQKPLIDSAVYDKWPVIGGPSLISNNGQYVLYVIRNKPTGSQTLVIQATQNKWKIEIPHAHSFAFTQDSRRAIFLKQQDSAGIIKLGTSSVEYLPGVGAYRLLQGKNGGYLAYRMLNSGDDLFIRNLQTGTLQHFRSVIDYVPDNDGEQIVLKTAREEEGDTSHILNLVNLSAGQSKVFWSGSSNRKEVADNIVFDKSNTKIAFVQESLNNGHADHSIWYYEAGIAKAEMILDTGALDAGKGLLIKNGCIQGFNKSGDRLFFNLVAPDGPKPGPDAVGVDVWNYKDMKLQSRQLQDISPDNFFRKRDMYLAAIDVRKHNIIRLQENDDQILEKRDDLILIENREHDAEPDDRRWNPSFSRKIFLVSASDGSRKEIKMPKELSFLGPRFSLTGKYVIYFDAGRKDYFSYNVVTGVHTNITKGINTCWTLYGDDRPDAGYIHYYTQGWFEHDTGLLICDQNDIWHIDPEGNAPAVNITSGLGKAKNIVFRLAVDHHDVPGHVNERVVLNAFDRNTKKNGFYSKELNKPTPPGPLSMGDYIYHIPDRILGSAIQKAANAAAFLVQRMSASESPNYFFTTDFKSFVPLSKLAPEKEYNWLRSQLVNWKGFDGTPLQGILYKPENFDSTKQYPVIFYYYEQLSDHLNLFYEPKPSSGKINIPLFVSNGYLVFVPDIKYKIGEPGKSAYNSVVSAAEYLSGLPFVNSKKMGLQGHSFGAFETNYIIAHTNIFAAACSASGIADAIRGYGSTRFDGSSKQTYYENSQYGFGATLWERRDLYLENSPVLDADKITTPVLLMNNKNDGGVEFDQGVSFFIALRRLGKRVWMLQYDGEGHEILGKGPSEDFTIRLSQFFDHYLKDAYAPVWMSRGIPAKLKGVDNGLQPDMSEVRP